MSPSLPRKERRRPLAKLVTERAPWVAIHRIITREGTRSVHIRELNEAPPPASCPVCQRLRREEAEAEARQDHSRAADC